MVSMLFAHRRDDGGQATGLAQCKVVACNTDAESNRIECTVSFANGRKKEDKKGHYTLTRHSACFDPSDKSFIRAINRRIASVGDVRWRST